MRQGDRVHFIGIDLAWGDKQPTGLAVIDDDARLLHVSAVRTDDEIAAGLAAYVEGDCLAAIDAPIVVTNATGSRPAEQQLSKDFRRYDAGTHPSNTGKPEFANGTRAARVAKRLGLDIDPRSGRRRRAIEVYPHPATIVLFGLPKVLRYKAKPGRDVDLLRSELLTLMTFVAGVVSTDETWAGLHDQVENATRKSELRRVEDQVDAVLCAYVAHFVEHRPDLVTRYGDPETGYIVTPTLGAEVVPPQADVVRDAVREYAAQHAELTRAGQQAVVLVQGLLDEAGINYLSVSGRTKSVPSFAEKAARTKAGTPLYTDPLTQITDLLGVRVITYVRDDVDAVADVLAEQVLVHDDRDWGLQTANEGRFGYASRHLMIGLDPAREDHPDFAHLRGHPAQVQVRTVLQHAWAEFEHDIRYKGTVPAEHVGEFDRRFTLAAGLLELADREFSEIRERLRGAAPDVSEARATTTRDSTPVSWRRSSPGSTRRRAGRGPTTTAGSPASCSSSASPRWSSWVRSCARPTRPPSPRGWTTDTRRAPCAGWTTPCSGSSASATSRCTRTPSGPGCSSTGSSGCGGTSVAGSRRRAADGDGPGRAQCTRPRRTRASSRAPSDSLSVISPAAISATSSGIGTVRTPVMPSASCSAPPTGCRPVASTTRPGACATPFSECTGPRSVNERAARPVSSRSSRPAAASVSSPSVPPAGTSQDSPPREYRSTATSTTSSASVTGTTNTAGERTSTTP